MKKGLLVGLLFAASSMLASIPVLKVETTDGKIKQYQLQDIDSAYFSASADRFIVDYSGDKQTVFASAEVLQLTYDTVSVAQDISIVWNNDGTVSITNPMETDGVQIIDDGSDVLIMSTYPDEVNYNLSGKSTDGSIKIYSDYKYQFTLLGLELTNPTGPAINSQSKKKGTIKMQKGYTNVLTDGSSYQASDEDQKGCIFSEGQLVFKGKGTLVVNANYKHGIASDDYIEAENGLLQITTTADAAKALKANDYITISDDAKIEITQSGKKVIDEGDVSYCAGMKADSTISILGGEVTITSSAEGGKGLNADRGVWIDGGTLNVKLSGMGGTYSQKDVDATGTGEKGESSSHKVYFYASSQGGGGGGGRGPGENSQWQDVELYAENDTKIATLSTTSVSENTAYVYTFSASMTGKYYFKGTMTSNSRPGTTGTSYDCKTALFSVPSSSDLYYRPGTYTTSGSTRVYSLEVWDPNAFQPGGGGSWGGTTDSDTQTYTCTCIKSDGYVLLTGGTITLQAIGEKGTCGIKCDGDLEIGKDGGQGPKLGIETTGTYVLQTSNGREMAYAGDPKGIKADGSVTMYGGEVTISTTGTAGEALESKTQIELKGGYLYAYSKQDDAINCAGKIICSGTWVYAVSDGNDAIDSNYGKVGAVTISNGIVIAVSSAGSPEEGLDADNNSYISITGGYVFSAGGAQGGGPQGGGSSFSGATQTYTTTSGYALTSGQYCSVEDGSGNVLFAFKVKSNVQSSKNSLSIISAPDVKSFSNYVIRTGSSSPDGVKSSWDNVMSLGGTSTATQTLIQF